MDREIDIELNKLTLPYAVTDLSARLPKNRLIGILGANGAGKSTLLKAIAGIISPKSGTIQLCGQMATELTYRQRSRLLAYLAQETPVYWSLSTYDTIALGLAETLDAADEYERVTAAANYFDINHLLEKPIQQLSGGERARVHLARCLVKDSPILLADEPIAALDPYYQLDIMQHLHTLSRQKTCVVVMHHLSLAYQFCDNVLLLKEGQAIASGKTNDVMIAENLATAFQISATINASTKNIYHIRQLRQLN